MLPSTRDTLGRLAEHCRVHGAPWGDRQLFLKFWCRGCCHHLLLLLAGKARPQSLRGLAVPSLPGQRPTAAMTSHTLRGLKQHRRVL